jgi:molybdopterin-guanine dinucleotide biosynthesis protein A
MSGSTSTRVRSGSPSSRRPSEVASPIRILGAIIAGGGSRRFGRPKATAEVGGLAMIDWSLRALVEVVTDVVVVGGDPAVAESRGLGHLVDAAPEGGPLAGLVSALRAATGRGMEGVFALACDMPLVNAAVVREVLRHTAGAEAVAPLGPRGPEQLCAFYPSACLGVAEERLVLADRSLKALLKVLPVHSIDVAGITEPAESEALLMSVNTPEDARRAEALLSHRSQSSELPSAR